MSNQSDTFKEMFKLLIVGEIYTFVDIFRYIETKVNVYNIALTFLAEMVKASSHSKRAWPSAHWKLHIHN